MSASIGQPVLRLEDEALLTGKGRFVDDIASPGVLHAAFVRSPHPHALISRIDAGAALAMAGVHAVLTLDDLAPVMTERRMRRTSNSGMPLDKCWAFALADGEVSYVGEPVALVLADNRYIAEDAAALVAVDYEPLPFVADVRDAAAAAAGTARTQVQPHHHLQGHVRRCRRRVQEGRARLSRGAVAAPRCRRIRSRRAASSPSFAAPTAASPCTPRPRRRTILRRR